MAGDLLALPRGHWRVESADHYRRDKALEPLLAVPLGEPSAHGHPSEAPTRLVLGPAAHTQAGSALGALPSVRTRITSVSAANPLSTAPPTAYFGNVIPKKNAEQRLLFGVIWE